MSISQGLVGPKGMAKAVLDGQWVNIPTLPYFVTGRRSAVCIADYWISCLCLNRVREVNPPTALDGERKRSKKFGATAPSDDAKRASEKNL